MHHSINPVMTGVFGYYRRFGIPADNRGRTPPKRKAVGSNPARDATSEWTTLHSKSPAVWLGFSHTAPSFLLLPTKLCFANFRGGPAARWAAMRGGVSLAASFFVSQKSSSRAHSAALRFPAKLCLRKFPRGPRPPCGRPCGAAHPLRRFFCKSHRALIPLLLVSPRNFACAKFHGGPRRPGGRQSASGAPPAAAFCFVFRPLLDRGGRICYADSQIIRKESVTHKTMDDGDSTEGENPPLPHIQSFIGHSLCLRE